MVELMKRLKGFFLSVMTMAWMTPAAAVTGSYYFTTQPREQPRLNELELTDWNQSRDVLQDQWVRSEQSRAAKYDISKFPADLIVDPNADRIELLAYENVFLFNSNPLLEKHLSDIIVNGDARLNPKLEDWARIKAALILLKLKPQEASLLEPLLKPLGEAQNFIFRQILMRIFIKASPNLSPVIVNHLKKQMKQDSNTCVRSLATLAVILNSENNKANLEAAVKVMIDDHRDIMQSLRPWHLVQDFIKQRFNLLIDTPTAPMPAKLQSELRAVLESYQVFDAHPEHNWALGAKNRLLLALNPPH